MTTMQSEVFEAFRDLGVAEDKAMRAAAALCGRDEAMLQVVNDLGALKRRLADVGEDVAGLKTGQTALMADTGV